MSLSPIFSHSYRIYINHTDAGGIVYHANHLSFYEHCRRDWFASLGLNAYFFSSASNASTFNDAIDRSPLHFVVTEAQLKYIQPILLDETIAVTIDNVTVRAASLIFDQSIYRLNNESLVNEIENEYYTPPTPSEVLNTTNPYSTDELNQSFNSHRYKKTHLLSRAKITIACVSNERLGLGLSDTTQKDTESQLKVRPIRLPARLREIIERALLASR